MLWTIFVVFLGLWLLSVGGIGSSLIQALVVIAAVVLIYNLSQQASGGELSEHATAHWQVGSMLLGALTKDIKQCRVMYGGIGCWRYPEAGVGSGATPYRSGDTISQR